MFYTYMHTRNDTEAPFYIGKGKGVRAWKKDRRNQHWMHIVKKHGYSVHLLANWPTEKLAFDHEKFLISCFRKIGIVLANKTDGGEGASGHALSEFSKAKIGAANTGRTHTKESIFKMSEAATGRKKSEAHKAAIGAAQKGRIISSKTRNLLSIKAVGRLHSEETRMKMSVYRKGKRASDATYKAIEKPIVCIETGKYFDSIADAAVWLKRTVQVCGELKCIASGISRHLNGKRGHTYGYTWNKI